MDRAKLTLIFICFLLFFWKNNLLGEDLFNKAVNLKNEGRYIEAIKTFKKYIKESKDYASEERIANAFWQIAQIYEKKMRDRKKAKFFYARIVRSYPDTSWKAAAQKRLKELAKNYPPSMPAFLKKNKSKIKIYEPSLLDNSLLEKVSEEEVRDVIENYKKEKKSLTIAENFASQDELITGNTIIEALFAQISEEPNISNIPYSIEISKPEKRVILHVNKVYKFLRVGDYGLLLKGKLRILLNLKNKTYALVSKSIPGSLDIYKQLIKRFIPLMFLNNRKVVFSRLDEEKTTDEVFFLYLQNKKFPEIYWIKVQLEGQPYILEYNDGKDTWNGKKFSVSKGLNLNLKNFKKVREISWKLEL